MLGASPPLSRGRGFWAMSDIVEEGNGDSDGGAWLVRGDVIPTEVSGWYFSEKRKVYCAAGYRE